MDFSLSTFALASSAGKCRSWKSEAPKQVSAKIVAPVPSRAGMCLRATKHSRLQMSIAGNVPVRRATTNLSGNILGAPAGYRRLTGFKSGDQ
jgi:hypothetical protein